MSRIGPQIEFSSTAFPPCEQDQQLVNHEAVHGYALARHVADRLPARGFEVVRMVAEDWGWWCEVGNPGFVLAYGCASTDRGHDFVLVLTPDRPRIRRWFRVIEVADRVEALHAAIRAILAESEGTLRP